MRETVVYRLRSFSDACLEEPSEKLPDLDFSLHCVRLSNWDNSHFVGFDLMDIFCANPATQ